MKRILLIAAIAVAYAVFRVGVTHIPTIHPAPSATFPKVAAVAAKMQAGDRAALADAYLILSRAVAANPTLEPVFPDTAEIGRAHV